MKSAKDRLVVMVTHNSELAEEYANRIIKLRDGRIVDDSNPFQVDDSVLEAPKHKNMGKASMSFLTSLSLSFNNLRTKKGRTILTAFAGSIGIIGIALILSLSTGVNDYINEIQKDTMASYPISIDAQALDIASILSDANPGDFGQKERTHDLDAVYSDSSNLERASSVMASITTNNLTEFKKYLDNPDSEIHQHLGSNGIVYSYDIKFDVYAYDPNGTLLNTDGSSFDSSSSAMVSGNPGPMGGDSTGMGGMSVSMGGGSSSSGNFEELLPGSGDKLISDSVTDNYSIVYGSWPQKYDEVVLFLDENNEISTSSLYELGLLPADEYQELLDKLNNNEEIETVEHRLSYDKICSHSFHIIPACDYYVENENGLYDNISSDKLRFEGLIKNSVQLKIVGIARVDEDADYYSVSGSIGYTKALSDYLVDYANNSSVVKAQEASPDTNVVSGMVFAPKDEQAKIADTIEYIDRLSLSDKAALGKEVLSMAGSGDPAIAQQIEVMSEVELVSALDQYLANPSDALLLGIYEQMISSGSYDDNMKAFGMVSLDAPSTINIYADSFENKDAIAACIEDYNNTVSEENQITYSDLVELLMASVTTIINVISYVLIAFVAVSLVVSSIMIGIITFISVLERTKEIGVLRAIGASKANISQVFNAETFIVGFLAGVIGIGLTLLILIPGNTVIHMITGSSDINASMPLTSAALLIVLSMALTLIAGLLPSRTAAKKDPVIALRTE